MDITRYEKQNNLRTGSLKPKVRFCRKLEVLLSSFDCNVVRDIIVSLYINT